MFWIKWVLMPVIGMAIGGGAVWFLKDYAWGKVANQGIETRSNQTERLHSYDTGRGKEARDENIKRRKSAREAIPHEWLEKDADPVVADYLTRMFPNTLYQDLRASAELSIDAAREAIGQPAKEPKE